MRLPVLPNGTQGWVLRSALSGYTFVDIRLVISLRHRRLTLYRAGRAIFRAPVGIGAKGTPTPRGQFYVRDRLRGYASPFYGPIAFGTSARSSVLTEWPAGGYIGIHGTNAPRLIPGRPSHGCVRMRDRALVRLARLLPMGPPSRSGEAARRRAPSLPSPPMQATTSRAVVATASTHREGLVWAFVGVLMFSFSVPLTKVAVGGFSPFLTATGRAAIAGIVAAALLAARRVPRPPARHLRPLLYTMLGAVFGWPILLALALERTTSAHVAVIAAFMPLTTALIAVLRTHERVTWQFWTAAGTGTAALVAFALSRTGGGGGDLLADGLVVGAVLASSWCYVEGASVTRAIPGWQVISWIVVMALPVTVPASAAIWWFSRGGYHTTHAQWASLALLGLSSMYVGFFAWYRGLSMAGIARGGQVQQLQALLTLVWSALLLGERVTAPTVMVALTVVGSVVWAQRGRPARIAAPQE